MVKTKQKFRLGGIQECMFLAIFISLAYTSLGVFAGFPLIHSDISDVFPTFILGIPISFVGLSLLEIFWFERDLDSNGRKKRKLEARHSSQA
jgi:xanthine/uracil permease